MSEVNSIVNKSTLQKFKNTYHQFLDEQQYKMH